MLKLSLALSITGLALCGASQACERIGNHTATTITDVTDVAPAEAVALQSTPESPDDLQMTLASKPQAKIGCARSGAQEQTVYLTD